MNEELVIGVSGINAVDNPGPGIGVARCLKADVELKTRLIGLSYDALDPGHYMQGVLEKSYILPYPSRSADEYVDRLQFIQEQSGMNAIIPCLDAELPLYINLATRLEDLGIKTFLPTPSQFRLRAKDQLPVLAEKTKLSIPETKVVINLEQLYTALNELELPVMVKGIYYEAKKAYTTLEAVNHFHKFAADWGVPIIVQSLVAGDELNVVGVGDGAGGLLGRVCMKKMAVSSLGKVWTAVSVQNQPMLNATEEFVRQTKWRGPFELECMVADEDVYLIEINPRFPAWTYFSSGLGVNLPARLVRKMFGLPFPIQTEYPSGKLFVRYSYELISDMSYFQTVLARGETP